MKGKKEIVRDTPEFDPGRETRVLLEEVHSSVKTIAEGHGVIIKRLDNVEGELSTVKTAVMENSNGIKALRGDVKILKRGQESLRSDVGTLKSDVDGLRVGQDSLKDGQDEIKQKLDTVVFNHEHRIKTLEAKSQ